MYGLAPPHPLAVWLPHGTVAAAPLLTVADGCLRSHLPPRALETSMGARYGPCVRTLAASHENGLVAVASA